MADRSLEDVVRELVAEVIKPNLSLSQAQVKAVRSTVEVLRQIEGGLVQPESSTLRLLNQLPESLREQVARELGVAGTYWEVPDHLRKTASFTRTNIRRVRVLLEELVK